MLIKRKNSLVEIYNNYSPEIFVYSLPRWKPYTHLISELKKKLNDGKLCKCHELVGNFPYNESFSSHCFNLIKLIFRYSFLKDLAVSLVLFFKIKINFKESNQLSKINVLGALSGDIIAAEYLRRGHGGGVLELDSKYLLILIKYLVLGHLFYRFIQELTFTYEKNKIAFSFPETSFFDELRRRILIKKGFYFEYSYNKYKDKYHLFKYDSSFLGRVHEYIPRIDDLDKRLYRRAEEEMNLRLESGKQFWTANPTDVNNEIDFSLTENNELYKNKPIALVCLHAVADDQYRCGLDCFKSIDDYHKFTINKLIDLDYQVLVKAHPGVVSDIHPDKAIIDKNYLIRLFKTYGLNYEYVLSSESCNIHRSNLNKSLYALNPKLSIAAISKEIKILVLTHHGSITLEAKAMDIDVIKYRFCKAREFDYAHSWKDKSEYHYLLDYYKKNKHLPRIEFKDSYLDVLTNLSQRNKHKNYNDIYFEISKKYLKNEKLREDIQNYDELYDLIDKTELLIKNNQEAGIELSAKLKDLLG